MKKLETLRKKINNRMFDVAAGPMYLMIFGPPILLIVVIGGLIYLAAKKIGQIHREKKKEDKA